MSALDAETAGLIRQTVRDAVARAAAGELSRLLAEAGWPDLEAEHPRQAARILFEEAGRGLRPEPLLDDVVRRALGVPDWPVQLAYTWRGTAGTLLRRGPVSPGVDVLVLDATRDAPRLVLVDAAAAFAPVSGMDASAGVAAADAACLRTGSVLTEIPADRAHAAISAARVAQAHELGALGDEMLGLAVAHVKTRTQFGVPIGSFQAVKHLLARATLTAAGAASVRAAAAGDPDDHALADLARAHAGRAALGAAKAAHQAMGAMGFTAEFPLIRFHRRAHVVDLLLGPWAEIARAIGGDVVRRRAPGAYVHGHTPLVATKKAR